MSKCLVITVFFVITLSIMAIYWPVQHYPFIDYDDNIYVYENMALQQDSLLPFIRWAFSDSHTGHWHPITWISHRIDWAMFGNVAGGHHWTNVIIHMMNAILLFFLLSFATGKTKRSAIVAMFFAVHPLNVESVVWIAERKNLLSTFFCLAAFLCYVRYTRRPTFGTYLPVLGLFSLGLMTKPMLVTMPALMLLWDYWPLSRLTRETASRFGRLFYEKLPFFVLSLISVIITIMAAKNGGALRTWTAFPPDLRLMNAVESYVRYIIKMIWPNDLAFFYPYPESFSVNTVLFSAVFLIAVTLYVLQKRHTHPVWFTGWFWYLIALLPVIGLVQVGYQAMADRYAYLSLIGLFVIAVWSVPDDWMRAPAKRIAVTVACVLIIFVLAVASRQQVTYWQDNKKLARQALALTDRNHIAHLVMGNALLVDGDRAGAASHYGLALATKPDYGEALNNLGNLYFSAGRYDEAGRHYKLAVMHNPGNVQARNNLGIVLLIQGKKSEAIACFREALRLAPWYRSPREHLRKLGATAE